MTIREALSEAAAALGETETPWLDATLLLAHVLDMPREKLLASFPDPLNPSDYLRFQSLLKRRQDNHPVAYILGQKEFFGRDFFVKEGVLCPRPDTEILVEAALDAMDSNHFSRIHDLCTGTGCIALTLAAERPAVTVSASDISPLSQEVFEKNRFALHLDKVSFTRTSLFENLPGPYDLIVTNPPYLTTDETSQRMDEGWKEPALALDGGEDGLDLIREIIRQAPSRLNPGGILMIEAASPQMTVMENLMEESGFYSIRILQDIESRDRVITGICRT